MSSSNASPRTVGASLAERIGRDSDDPEVELTAIVIAGLARVWALATYTQVQRVSSLAALERAVRADVTRAANSPRRLSMPSTTSTAGR